MHAAIILLLLTVAPSVWADRHGFSVQAGGFYAFVNSHIQARDPDTDSGIKVDFEDNLNLEESRTTTFAGFEYRFKDKHSFALNYFQLYRNAVQDKLTKPFELDNESGETELFQVRSQVKTQFDVDVYQLRYAYSFYQNENWDVALSLGAHLIHITMSLEGRLTGDVTPCSSNQCELDDLFEKVTAPLPDLGIFAKYKLDNNYTLGLRAQYLAIEIDDIDGSLTDFMFAVNRAFKDNWSVGLAYQLYRIRIDGEGDNALWDVEFSYHGPALYLRYDF